MGESPYECSIVYNNISMKIGWIDWIGGSTNGENNNKVTILFSEFNDNFLEVLEYVWHSIKPNQVSTVGKAPHDVNQWPFPAPVWTDISIFPFPHVCPFQTQSIMNCEQHPYPADKIHISIIPWNRWSGTNIRTNSFKCIFLWQTSHYRLWHALSWDSFTPTTKEWSVQRLSCFHILLAKIL